MQPSIISSRASAGFAALLLILVVIFVASVRGASRLVDLGTAVTRARDVLQDVGAARATLRELESARRAYLLTRERMLLEVYLATMNDASTRLARLRALGDDDPAVRRRVDAITALVARQSTLVADAIADAEGRHTAAADPLPDDGAVSSEQIRRLGAELEAGARARLREREADANQCTVAVVRGFGGVALVALLLLGAAYYLLDRDAGAHAAELEALHDHRRATPAERARPGEPEAAATGKSEHERPG